MIVFKTIGIILILLGIAMFLVGISMFSYLGPPLDSIVVKIGMYSFLWWLPTILFGVFLVVISPKKRT